MAVPYEMARLWQVYERLRMEIPVARTAINDLYTDFVDWYTRIIRPAIDGAMNDYREAMNNVRLDPVHGVEARTLDAQLDLWTEAFEEHARVCSDLRRIFLDLNTRYHRAILRFQRMNQDHGSVLWAANRRSALQRDDLSVEPTPATARGNNYDSV